MSQRRPWACLALVAALSLGSLVAPAAAGEAASGTNAAHNYFTDVELVDQYGETQRLYSDLLAGRVVVINSFFTECDGICPFMSRNLKAIQEWLGDRLGQDALMLSISVDPETDTPQRVREFAARWDARPGWYFLTGRKENVELALAKLGMAVEDREAHSSLLIIGNEPTGLWKKALGMASAQELVGIVESVLEDPGSDGAEHASR